VQSRWATVAGIRGHALAGGSGPAVVLVHGLGVSSRYFAPLARRLQARHTVLAPDLPGYGRSATPPRALDIPPLADALREWLDVVGIPAATLVGNSLGCQIAVDLALRAPDRVPRLVLIGPSMDPGAPSLLRQAVRLGQDALREPIGLTLTAARDYVRMGPRRVVATARFALADPLVGKLERVGQPALVLRGARDPIVSQRWAEEVARRLPRGRLVVLRRAPHAAHWDAPWEVARLVEEFH
jgi:2-hydroxy-6-oxonona-2,4-dienedioate hydrolase